MDVQASTNYATQLISVFTEPLQSQYKKKCKKSSVVEKLEFLCTAVGSVKWQSYNGKQYEDSSKS
jgi:hypothetical protein